MCYHAIARVRQAELSDGRDDPSPFESSEWCQPRFRRQDRAAAEAASASVPSENRDRCTSLDRAARFGLASGMIIPERWHPGRPEWDSIKLSRPHCKTPHGLRRRKKGDTSIIIFSAPIRRKVQENDQVVAQSGRSDGRRSGCRAGCSRVRGMVGVLERAISTLHEDTISYRV
jgi:hypothetical protein